MAAAHERGCTAPATAAKHLFWRQKVRLWKVPIRVKWRAPIAEMRVCESSVLFEKHTTTYCFSVYQQIVFFLIFFGARFLEKISSQNAPPPQMLNFYTFEIAKSSSSSEWIKAFLLIESQSLKVKLLHSKILMKTPAQLLSAHKGRLTKWDIYSSWYQNRGVAHLSPNTVFESASGVYLHDAISGKRYLDFSSGIGVVNTGHCHPKVIAAAKQQIDKIVHVKIWKLWSKVIDGNVS